MLIPHSCDIITKHKLLCHNVILIFLSQTMVGGLHICLLSVLLIQLNIPTGYGGSGILEEIECTSAADCGQYTSIVMCNGLTRRCQAYQVRNYEYPSSTKFIE